VSEPTVAELEAIGVYDPRQPHAAQTLELLQYLIELGASVDDLEAYRDQLSGLASVLAIRGGALLTLAQAAEKSGLSEDKLLRISRAAGFPDPGREDRVFSPRFSDLVGTFAAAESVFGEDAVLQLVRVMGSTMARLADALVSAFLVNVEPGAAADDPVGLRVAHANAEAGALLPVLGPALDILLRQHLLGARRSSLGADAQGGYETRAMCVGFVDLVGSTALGERLSTPALGAMLTDFEHIASEVVTDGGGRVVKLIGDEVLFTATDEGAACAIALELLARLRAHPSVPDARAGLASGRVMLRDGDVFGPVVNLAARAVGVARPGEVLAPADFAAAARVPARPLAPRQLKGLVEPVELSVLSP
jgi:adenylate cyclase